MESCSFFFEFMNRLGAIAWLEWAKVIFDLFKGLAWPAVIFILVFMFRKHIQDLIPRLREIGKDGAKFNEVQQQKPQASPPPLEIQHPFQTVTELAKIISEQLQGIDADQRQPRLVEALAVALTQAEFEAIFANIFQSQVDALGELCKGTYTIEVAQIYFQETVTLRNPELYTSWDFKKWSDYLVSTNLVMVHENTVEITKKGRDFFDFATRFKSGFHRSN